MAQMNLDALQTIVRDSVANADLSRITRAANMALRRLYSVAGPTVRFTVTTTAPYETGTVAITKGDTAVTLTGGTFAASTDGQLFRGEGESTWYGFTRGGATSGTLASGFAGTTLTTGTFDIAYAFYDLPTTISSAFNLWRDTTPRMYRMNDDEFTRYMDGPQEPGLPHSYALVKGTHATNSAVRVMLIPFPDAVYTFTGSGRARPTLFTNASPTTEYSGLPEDYDDALHAGTLYFLWDAEDQENRSGWWKAVWEEALRKAVGRQMEGGVGQFGEAQGRTAWVYQRTPGQA